MAENLLSTVVHRTMPGSHVRPESQRPRLAEVVSGARIIPVVDLACPDRAAVVAAIGDACRSHGFFQVLNHGIDDGLLAGVMAVARDFFRLPAEERAKLYSDDHPARKIRLSTSFNARKETVHNWRDYLRVHCHPIDYQFVPDWPSSPPDFKETMSSYCKEVGELGFRLYAAISESLGLDSSYILKETLGEQELHMAVNFYDPPCRPSPELTFTYGLPAHTDPNALTVQLMDDQDVAGLQAQHAGKWVAVNDPQPGALIINIGDQLQALSNGQYRSVWLRAVVNSDQRLQVRVDESAGANAGDPIPIPPLGPKKASGEDDGRGNGHRRGRGNLSAMLGIAAASSAVHAVAVGVTPVAAFGLAVVMFAAVSMAMAGFL
ncbi:unnamed protein product [Urochloa humidicola]